MVKRHVRYSDRSEARIQELLFGHIDESLYTTASENRKLTPCQVECLRNLRSAGVTYTDLGKWFGISKQAARNIGLGKVYRERG